MRIIHFVSSDKISGLEILSMNMLREMAKDHEVYYSCPDGDGIRRAKELGLGTIVCNTRSKADIKRVCAEYEPDAVHAHDPAVSFTCALAGIKFVAHLHANCSWLSKICPNSVALLFVCLRAQKVICVSDSIVNQYVFKNALKKKSVVISNFVDSDSVLEMSREECAEMYDISYVGRLVEEKNPLMFLETVSKVAETRPDVKAVMIGDGDKRGEVESSIISLGLQNNVTLKGFDINPYRFVKNSRVGVLTSSVEGFGLVAVEAMILGKPYVAFPVGGLVDIISDENGKLCISTSEMAEEILKLLSDCDYYNSKSAAAEKSSKKFTDKKGYVNKILEIYDGIKKGR